MAVSDELRRLRDIVDSPNQSQAFFDIFQTSRLSLSLMQQDAARILNPNTDPNTKASAEYNIVRRAQAFGSLQYQQAARIGAGLSQFVGQNIGDQLLRDFEREIESLDAQTLAEMFVDRPNEAEVLERLGAQTFADFDFAQSAQGRAGGIIAPEIQESLRADFSQVGIQRTAKAQRAAASDAIAQLFLDANLTAANRGSQFLGDIRFEATAERELLQNLGKDLQEISGDLASPSGFVRLGRLIEEGGDRGEFAGGLERILPNTGETAEQFRRRLGREIESRTVQTELDLTSPFFRDRFGARRVLRRPRTTETGGSDTRLGAAQPTGVLI